jgi:hypothetical protein
MTVYSVKVDKHETFKTHALYEARAKAKEVLAKKLADRYGADMINTILLSVNEKIHIYRDKSAYRFYATVHKRGEGMKTFSVTINCEHISNGGYHFDLHKELVKAVKQLAE